MSSLAIAKTIEFNESISTDQILETIRKCLKKEFSGVKVKTRKNKDPYIRCRVRTGFFNPIVSLVGTAIIQTNENKAKIMLDVSAKPNMWFWFTFLLGIVFILPLFLMFFMWNSQKKKSLESLQRVFDRLEFEYGKI